MNALTTLARSGTLNLAGTFVGGLSGLALVLVVTNGFPAELAGLLFAATSLFLIVTALAELGADAGLSHTVQRQLVAGRHDRARTTLRVALVPVLGTSLLLALLGWFGAPLVAGLLTDPASADSAAGPDTATAMLRVLAVALPIATAYSAVLASTRAYGTMRPNVLVDKLGRLPAQILAVGLVAVTGAGPVWLAVAWALPYLPGLLVISGWYRAISGPVARDETTAWWDHELARTFWSFTAPRAVGRVCQVAMQRADVVLVAALIGPRAAAIYTAVTKFLAVGQLATNALQQVLQPQLSRLFAAGDLAGARQVFGTATAWLIAMAWPIYLVGAVAAPLILRVFGDGYDAGSDALVILTLTMLVAVACGPVDTALLMAGRSRQSLLNSAVALAINLLLIFLLVPPFGLTGAAVAWAVALVVRNLLPVLQIWRAFRLLAFGPASAWAAGSALACFGLVPLLAVAVFGRTIPTLAIVLPLMAAVYAGLLWRERELLELSVFAPAARRLLRGVPAAVQRRVVRLASRSARLVRRLPMPVRVRVLLSRLFLRRLRPVDVPMHRLLLGSQDGASLQRYAAAFDDLLWGSTPIARGPHAELLRLAGEAGPRGLSDSAILESAYGEHARRCLVLSGRYFWATDDAGIVQVARSFIARACGDVGPDGTESNGVGPDGAGAAVSRPSDPILVAPIKDSDCFSVIDGHHRLAAASHRGASAATVTVKRVPVTTPLQDLLTRMSWIGGKKELYQPLSAPELDGRWAIVRQCTDRLEKIDLFLSARGLPRTDYRKPTYLDVACCYGWFVAQMGALGFAAHGLERDPLGRQLGAAVYTIDPERIDVGDAGAYLRDAVEDGRRWDVVSCFSLLHHFVLGRGDGTTAEELVRLLSSVTRDVLFLDTGQEHEAWFGRSLAGWGSERIATFLREHGDFTEVVDLGPDSDALPPYADNYGRHLFACVKGRPADLSGESPYAFLEPRRPHDAPDGPRSRSQDPPEPK